MILLRWFSQQYSVSRALKPFCPIRDDHPTIKELIDYDPFCGIQPASAFSVKAHPPSLLLRRGEKRGGKPVRADIFVG